jgi:hypothetical protein
VCSRGIAPPPNFWSQTLLGTFAADGFSFDTTEPNDGSSAAGLRLPASSISFAVW